jgi:hypothetical protein
MIGLRARGSGPQPRPLTGPGVPPIPDTGQIVPITLVTDNGAADGPAGAHAWDQGAVEVPGFGDGQVSRRAGQSVPHPAAGRRPHTFPAAEALVVKVREAAHDAALHWPGSLAAKQAHRHRRRRRDHRREGVTTDNRIAFTTEAHQDHGRDPPAGAAAGDRSAAGRSAPGSGADPLQCCIILSPFPGSALACLVLPGDLSGYDARIDSPW